jgi:hypothetical protein
MVALSLALPVNARVHTVSTDGEATVYLDYVDFSHDFDLAYDAALASTSPNHSWTVLGIALLGHTFPSASLVVGLTRGDVAGSPAAVFVSTARPRKPNTFRVVAPTCAARCRIELRGTSRTIEARLNGRVVASWLRSDFPMRSPYIQLNAEVDRLGDSIRASLARAYQRSDGRAVAAATCGFTTRGVEPRRAGEDELLFSGTHREGARVTYISLVTGKAGDTCAEATRRHA